MKTTAKLGRNPAGKHQIQPEYGDEQPDEVRDCRTRIARPCSQVKTGTGKKTFFPVELTMSWIGNLTRLILALAIYVMKIHTWYFQHAHFIPIAGVGKIGAYQSVDGDLPRQHSFGTTLMFSGPVPADSRQRTPSVRNCVTR